MNLNKKIILVLSILILLFANVSAYDFLIRNSSNQDVYFKVTGDGQVGINTDDPKANLDINGEMGFSDKAYYKSSANLGKFQHSFASRDYVDKKDTSTVYSGELELVGSDGSATYIETIWSDGNFIYVADNDGDQILSYSVDSSGKFTLKDTESLPNAAKSVWGDGNFLYVASYDYGIRSYSVDSEGQFIFIDSDDQGNYYWDVWGDGNFLYVAGGSNGLISYSVNSTGGFTFIDSNTPSGYAYSVKGDGDYIYVGTAPDGIYSYSVNSTGGLTFIDSDDQGGNYVKIDLDENFVYIESTEGVYSYSVNSTGGLSYIATGDLGGNYPDGLWREKDFLYVIYNRSIGSFFVDSSGQFTFIDYIKIGGHDTGIFGDSHFIYAGNATQIKSFKRLPAYEYDKADQSHYFDDHVGIGIDDPSENLVVADNMMAYNDDEDGTYIGFFKGTGSLTGYSSDDFPVIKSDNENIYFAPQETYAGAITSTGLYAHIINNVGTDALCWDGSGGSYFGDCSSLTELKRDIENISVSENLWEKYMKLQPVNYRWKDPGWQQNLQTGFLAEQVESVDPLLADYAETFNETTNEKSTELRGINFDAITSVNVLMIQDLKKETEKIKNELCRNKNYDWCKNKKYIAWKENEIFLKKLKNKLNY